MKVNFKEFGENKSVFYAIMDSCKNEKEQGKIIDEVSKTDSAEIVFKVNGYDLDISKFCKRLYETVDEIANEKTAEKIGNDFSEIEQLLQELKDEVEDKVRKITKCDLDGNRDYRD